MAKSSSLQGGNYSMRYENRVKISNTNTKLGACICSINQLVGATCRPDAPCKKGCYAKKGGFLYPRSIQRYCENLSAYIENPELYRDDIISQIRGYDFIRWHSAGDIIDSDYFLIMIEIAKHYPKKHFLCYTKKYEIVNAHIDNNRTIPKNLEIIFSGWDENWNVPNPHNLPISIVEFKDDTRDLSETQKCPADCSTCKKCWFLKDGETLAFHKH